MSSRRFIYGSLVLVLFLLNVVQGIIILKILEIVPSRVSNVSYSRLSGRMDMASAFRSGVISEDLQDVLFFLNVTDTESFDLSVLVSPFPCQACADIQNAIIYEESGRFPKKQIRLLVSPGVEKDYRAYFSDRKNVAIKSYSVPEESEENALWVVSDGGYLYFTEDKGRIKDFYIIDKNNSDASRFFVERVLE